MIKIGQCYYDERNDRYITTESTGCDPKVWRCTVEEYDADIDDIAISGMQLFNESELRKMVLM